MTFFKLLSFLSVVVAASAGPMVLHERRTAVPSGFVRHGAAPANQTITLRVALTASNVGGLEEKIASLATPGSPDFRQWLSKDDVRAFSLTSSTRLKHFAGKSLCQPIPRNGLCFRCFCICQWPHTEGDLAEWRLGVYHSPSLEGQQALCSRV